MKINLIEEIKKLFPYRLPICFLGMIFVGIGLSFVAYAGLGFDSFSTMAYGLSLHMGLSLGQSISFIQVSLMIAIFFIDRKHISLATFLLSVGVGTVVDIALALWNAFLPSPQGVLFYAVFLVLLGVILLSVGINIYQSADLGSGSVDSVAEILVEKTKFSYASVRIALEAFYLVCGMFLGAPFGITAVVCILGLGPFVQIGKKYIRPHFDALMK